MTTARIIRLYRKYCEGPQHFRGRKENVDRNANLFADYSDPKRKGFIVDLVVKYRISSVSIFEIVKRVREMAISQNRIDSNSLKKSRKSKLPSDSKKMAERGASRGDAEASSKDGGTHATKSRPPR